MEGGGRPTRVELAVATNGLISWQRLHLDTPLSELVERLRIWAHLRIRARAHDQTLRQLLEDVVEIVKNETMSICAPPVGDNATGENDHIASLLLAVDDEMAEPVSLDPRHSLKPFVAA
jgi:hypothetical protein